MAVGRRLFRDRRAAGRALAARLREMALEAPVVLALPRGGVPLGREIADALGAPLDLLLVRKIGAPGQPELALAAVADGTWGGNGTGGGPGDAPGREPAFQAGPTLVRNDALIAELGVSESYLESEARHKLAEIERRRQRYLGDRPGVSIAGRSTILVDDGLATGASVRAAVQILRRRGPARIVLAVPVAPAEVVARLSREVDDLVCLETPEDFRALSLYYEDFHQLSDEEVVELLREQS